MRVQYIGHAGLLVESCGVSVLCDPWFSRTGAFNAAWYPLPSNQHLASTIRDRKFDYIYLSHEHSDHFDPDFLAGVCHDATLLVPGYPSGPWREEVRRLKFARTCFIRDAEERQIAPGLTAMILQAPSPFVHDSVLVLHEEATGQVMVNVNDCSIDEEQATAILRRFGRVDIALCQFSGAIWFPFVYEFNRQAREEAARNMVRSNFDRWLNTMLWLKPMLAVPFAGPVALLDPDIDGYFRSSDSIFPTPHELRTYLAERDPALLRRLTVPLPGDCIDLGTGAIEQNAAIHGEFDWAACDAYLPSYAMEMQGEITAVIDRYAWPERSVFDEFERSMQELFAAAPTFSRTVNARVVFQVDGPGGGRWLVDFANLSVSDLTGDERPREEICDYEFRFASRYVRALASYQLRWEDFLLSFRFKAWRPGVDAYNMHLTSFLRFGRPEELAQQEKLLLKARRSFDQTTFELETQQGCFQVQEFCPHMGQRLTPACYDAASRTITCPRHGWRFEVPSGRCLNARASLRVDSAAERIATA